jgi:alkaline phosphatase
MRLLWIPFLLLLHGPPIADNPPRNVIIMIGDGMGLTHITAALYAQNTPLHMERMPVTGVMSVESASEKVTDSAASATAMATGCKTNNGMLGMTPQRKPCTSLFTEARKHQKAIGINVSCSVVHATPAAFVATEPRRSHYEQIARAYTGSQIDLLMGGGRKYFDQRLADQRNLIAELQQMGYHVADQRNSSLQELPVDGSRPLIWFTSDEEPPPIHKGRVALAESTAFATRFLNNRNPNGFLLVVEGAQIDWASHQNNAEWLVAEVLDFDAAVGEALRFAKEDGETLVVVTADHETGGVSILQGSTPDSLLVAFASKKHTASLIPVLAYGPGAQLFEGLYDNTDIYFKIKKALGWMP